MSTCCYCLTVQEPSTTKNSSSSRAPKTGAQLQTTRRSAKKCGKNVKKTPSPPPYPAESKPDSAATGCPLTLNLRHLHCRNPTSLQDHRDVHDRKNHPVLVDNLLHKTLENPSREKNLRTNRHPTPDNTIREPTLGLPGAVPDKENVRRSIFCTAQHHAQHTHTTRTPHPHTNTGASRAQSASACLLAASQLHQPSLPQGSGTDWQLSPRAHDKRDSLRGGVVVLCLLLLFCVCCCGCGCCCGCCCVLLCFCRVVVLSLLSLLLLSLLLLF